ncbi:TonB-dependent receptor [Gammaproteobacteria bacterium]|nr:TonB-dependent receptor [Gammaproteobacteria bacterium]MDA9800550.1 TonB-dependent receptor [Gammaproteobacteria bacterium]
MKRLFALTTVIVFTAMPTTSFAQDSNLVLEEVVVTATKKEENVQDIAQTVNAVSGSDLDDYQIRNLGELAQLVSGVEFTQIDPRRQTIIMRGQKLDPDGGNDQPIQGYVDEMPLRTGEMFMQMYDTERVELLKGSQGTLQGVVGSGGALHIYTRSAQVGSGERNGYVKTTFADNMTSIYEFASDLHLSDTLALRVAGVSNNNNGTEVKNITTGVDESHSFESIRLSMSWEPSDELTVRYKYQRSETDSIYPQAVAGTDGTPTFAQRVNGARPFLPASLATLRAPEFNNMPAEGFTVEDRTAVQYHDPRQNNSAFFHNLMIDYDMGSHLLALRYSESESHAMGILDRDYPGAYVYGYPQEVRTLTEIDTIEGRISNQDNDKLEYTLGFFSRDSQTFTTYDLDRSYVVTEIFPAIMKPIVGFDYKTPFNACNAGKDNPAIFADYTAFLYCTLIPVDAKVEAAFANFKYNLSEKTFIQFGVREQEINNFQALDGFLPITQVVPVTAGGGMTIPFIPPERQSSSTDSTTGSFKIGHYLNDDVLLYVSTERGFRRGSISILTQPVSPSLAPFGDEESDMVEIGMKGQFLEGRLRLNASYYDYTFEGYQAKWDNVTVRTYTPVGGLGPLAQVQGGIFNNNDASLSGIDLDWAYVVRENLILGGSYTSVESEFDAGSVGYANDPSYTGMLAATRDVSGEPLNDAAESSLSFYLEHNTAAYWGGERYTRYNVSWRDERSSRINPDLKIKALYLANLFVGWRSSDEKWDASLFVKNITDDVDLTHIQSYYSDYGIAGGSSQPSEFYAANGNAGRQIGVNLVYNF